MEPRVIPLMTSGTMVIIVCKPVHRASMRGRKRRPDRDRNGVRRPLSYGYDQGAFEFTHATWV